MCKNFRHFRDKKCVKMRHFLPVFSTFTVDLIDFFLKFSHTPILTTFLNVIKVSAVGELLMPQSIVVTYFRSKNHPEL